MAAQNVQVATESLNVRSGPAVTYDKVAQITAGQQLPLIQKKGDWLEIQLANENHGWVLAAYVKIIDVAPLWPQSVVITGNSVNVRSGPGTTFPVSAGVNKGAVLSVTGQKGDWYQVKLANAVQGWITTEFAKAAAADPGSGPVTVVLPTDDTTPGATPSTTPGTTSNTAPTTAVPSNKIKALVVTATSLNVRLAPSLSAEKLTTIPQGSRLNYLAMSGDWFQVSLADGRKGWVASALVSFSNKAVSSWIPPLPEIPVPADLAEADGQDGNDADADDQESDDQSAGSDSQHPLAGKTIVIDPGHGSLQTGGWIDPGAIGSGGTREYEVVMNIAAELSELLNDAGANVVLTREGETDLTLDGRTQLANELPADVFVSIHANSAPTSQLNGTSTYYYLVPVAGDVEQAACRKFLAQSIQTALVDRLARTDLGTRQENFAVLRTTLMPSVLVETAFLSNSEEEMLLNDPDFQEQAAEGIFAGLAAYFQKFQ